VCPTIDCTKATPIVSGNTIFFVLHYGRPFSNNYYLQFVIYNQGTIKPAYKFPGLEALDMVIANPNGMIMGYVPSLKKAIGFDMSNFGAYTELGKLDITAFKPLAVGWLAEPIATGDIAIFGKENNSSLYNVWYWKVRTSVITRDSRPSFSLDQPNQPPKVQLNCVGGSFDKLSGNFFVGFEDSQDGKFNLVLQFNPSSFNQTVAKFQAQPAPRQLTYTYGF